MTFKSFRTDIENYLDTRGAKVRLLIKQFTNKAILEFARTWEWEKIKVVETITLDDSGSYTLDSTNLDNNYGMILDLFNEDGRRYDKYDYEVWLGLDSKSYTYAIVGKTLYVTGDDADLSLLMTTPGSYTNYPITTDTQEPELLEYYSDIIQKMVIVKMLKYMEDEQYQVEQQTLGYEMNVVKKFDCRLKNEGKIHTVRRM